MKVLEKKSWPVVVADAYNAERQRLATDSATMSIKNTEKILGIDCVTHEVASNSPQVKHFLGEVEAEHVLRKHLNSHEITPLAILPKKVFDDLIADLPFYSFRNISREGKVQANVERAIDGLESKIMGRAFGIFFVICTIGWTTLAPPWGRNIPAQDVFTTSLLWSLLSLVVAFFSSGACTEIFKAKKRFKKSDLWPAKNDSDLLMGGRSTPEWVQLILPEAPQDIQDVLKRCQRVRLNTYLVVHERAFDFFISKEQIARARKMSAKHDPIICSDMQASGYEFTVVYGQYGDFPEEQKLVTAIQKKFNAIRTSFVSLEN